MRYHKSLPTFGESVLSGILLASSACSLDAPPSAYPELAERLFTPEPSRSVIVFTPAPEWLAEARKGAARWAWSTGTDIRVGDGGIPLGSVAELLTPDGRTASGGTYRNERGDCEAIALHYAKAGERTVAHEMGHCIGGRGHTLSGMMSSHGSNVIDAASLEKVCAEWHCASMTPEG